MTNELTDKELFASHDISYIEKRNEVLKDISYNNVRRAWFNMSHLLLDEGSKILDMGCGDGDVTYAMAALYPKMQFIGIDKSIKTIKSAKARLKLANLKFKIGDVSGDLFEKDTIDAIINSYTLHEVFSNARYNERIVSDTLRKQFTMLKNNGQMFIRDYAKPMQGEFVLLEMHDDKSTGEKLKDLSEADLLVWYSEQARPKQDPGCGGFFLEELEPRFPRTRLFRLPYKWAYEFIMRKDSREIWESNLPFEYTFYTEQDFRRELRSLGARVQYSAPHWNDDHIKKYFDGHFRLLSSSGDPLGDPPTSFIVVAQKKLENTSLVVKERRITKDSDGILNIKTVINQSNGALSDLVTRDKELAEILPYRLNDEGRLYIYLHDGIIRGITNAVKRSGVNIDGRTWSGHMLEAISTNLMNIKELGIIDAEKTDKFTKLYLGLKPQNNAVMEKGNTYYPDPNYIDERITTYFVNIQKDNKHIAPKRQILETHRFREKGMLREFNAQHVIDAIAVGLIPNARLELQILSLMHHLKVKAENWISKDISVVAGEITNKLEISEFLRQAGNNDKRFKEVKDQAGQIKTINSIFIEEGQSNGWRKGISSEHVDFVLSDEKTINTAVVMPLTKSTKRDIHAGFVVKYMPVPQRHENNGLSASVPQFNIPKEITNNKMLKQFIAEKFGLTPDMVLKLGESYFSHVGITPQRIHPFAILAPPDEFKNTDIKFLPIYQYMLLWKSISKEQHFMTVLARAYRYLPAHIGLKAKKDVKLMLDNIFREAQPDWSLPAAAPATKPETTEFNKKSSGTDKDDNNKTPKLNIKKANKKTKTKVQEKKEKRRKKKLGLGASKDDEAELNNNEDSGDPEIAEAKNKKKEAAKNIDISLVEDFEYEVNEIKDALEDDFDEKPTPDKW